MDSSGWCVELGETAVAVGGPGVVVVSFEELYLREFDAQSKRAFLLLGDRDAAFDVVQAAFVGLFGRYDRVSEPGAYLNTAVLNGCRDHARRAKVRQADLNRRVEPAAESVEFLSDVLMRLPFNQRAAVVLKFYVGLTEGDIAARLDCPVGSIGPWIHRALRSMERELT